MNFGISCTWTQTDCLINEKKRDSYWIYCYFLLHMPPHEGDNVDDNDDGDGDGGNDDDDDDVDV